MVIEPADRHEDGIDPRAQNDECQREARHRYPARAWPQRGKYRQGRHDRDREREAHQRQAELCPGEGADQEPAFGGVALHVTKPDIVLNPCLVVLPDHHLPGPGRRGRGARLGRRARLGLTVLRHYWRLPARSTRSRTSRAWRRLTGSERPETLTLWLLPETENSVILPADTR